jgi:hypothetical protein
LKFAHLSGEYKRHRIKVINHVLELEREGLVVRCYQTWWFRFTKRKYLIDAMEYFRLTRRGRKVALRLINSKINHEKH